ncbi:MAG: TolC family protein [Candidatus Scalindua sp.]|nr:TolC family protein [Candidatus Scalindua sp.]
MCKRTVYNILVFLSVLISTGCASHYPHDHAYVSDSINDRTGHNLGSDNEMDGFRLPDDVSLAGGLTEYEAVAIALWNNARFQADLTDLGFSRADLIEAGMISNPEFTTLLSTGPKQMEAFVFLPLVSLWQRPYQVSAAKLSAERVAENLVQNGLNLVRDVIMTYSDLLFAQKRVTIAEEEKYLAEEIAVIVQAQLRAGDISELEETTFQLEAAQKQRDLVGYRRDAALLGAKLKTLMGMEQEENTLTLTPAQIDDSRTLNLDELLTLAYAARPDLRAAEIAIEEAGKRLGWERSKIFNFTAVADYNERGTSGPEFGPGFRFELPVFNQNNGKVARSHAQLELAIREYLVVKHEIALRVREAYTNYRAAQKALMILRTRILRMAATETRKAEKQYSIGEISYLDFLGFKRRLLDSRLRDAESEAELRRSSAELRHSVGFRLDSA